MYEDDTTKVTQEIYPCYLPQVISYERSPNVVLLIPNFDSTC